jgi:glycosyltransferase involved in cell wall biosynthesis
LNSEQVSGHVHLLGFRENVVDYYAMSDMGLLPTTFEGESFPLSIIECFMAGRPIMVSDVGEVRNMLTAPSGGLAGWLIDISRGYVDAQQVGKELAQLAISDEAYLTKMHFAETLADRFDMNQVGSDYSEVYCA